MYFEALITGVVLFLNRHRGSQAELTTTYPLVVPLGTSLRPDVPPLEALNRTYANFWSAPIPVASLQPAMPQPAHAVQPTAALPPSADLSTALAQALSARAGLLPTAAHQHHQPPTPAAAAAFQRAAGAASFAPPGHSNPLPFATAAAVASSSPALSSSLGYVPSCFV